MKVYEEFLQKVTSKDLNTRMMLCEIDYLPPAFRNLCEEQLEKINHEILTNTLIELENVIHNHTLKTYPAKEISVSLYKKEIKKFSRLYIEAAMRILTKLLIDIPDLLVGYCPDTKDLYYYDWKEGFVRRVSLVYRKSIFEDEFPEASRKILLSDMNIIYGFDDLSRYDQEIGLSEEDIQKLC